jgi:signal transduction histidine kinase
VAAEHSQAPANELVAWRGLALILLHALTESRAGRAADVERHLEERAVQQASYERQIVRDREDFLALVAHELKTPVAVVKAYAELLEAQMADRESSIERRTSMREVVVHIVDQAELMSTLIEEILDVQRVQLGKLPLQVSHLDLAELARSAAEEVAQATRAHTISVESTDQLPPVAADRRRIRQVLVNLLENAVKYSDVGDIEVKVGRSTYDGKPMALLSVHDHGIGLEASDVSRIFERFAQANSAPVRGHAGLGLGLYVARQITRAHGGDVWAESDGKGRGSTFHIRLPLHTELATD